MKILWFEVTVPGRYNNYKGVLGGWQDSLERIVRTIPDIELTIAFESNDHEGIKIIDGVRYIPIDLNYTEKEKKTVSKTWKFKAEKLISAMMNIVQNENPNLIQVFGTEWPFGLIANHTDVPVVIHIQGSIAPFNNALFPPRYSIFDVFRNIGWQHPRQLIKAWDNYKNDIAREKVEKRVWKSVENFMGRTEWDKALSSVMHPNRNYFHVEEALRPYFSLDMYKWEGFTSKKIKILSTGLISFRKGPDMMLKTAYLLKTLGIDFEWNIAGFIPDDIKKTVEQKEGLSFEKNDVIFHGFVDGNIVLNMLRETTIFVHTAYAENSPNSICEAQCLGVPVVATNVGGVSSLVHDKVDGVLVPPNDPWMMAYQIFTLVSDLERLNEYSLKSRKKALKRHNDENIKLQLIDCYKSLISQYKDR